MKKILLLTMVLLIFCSGVVFSANELDLKGNFLSINNIDGNLLAANASLILTPDFSSDLADELEVDYSLAANRRYQMHNLGLNLYNKEDLFANEYRIGLGGRYLFFNNSLALDDFFPQSNDIETDIEGVGLSFLLKAEESINSNLLFSMESSIIPIGAYKVPIPEDSISSKFVGYNLDFGIEFYQTETMVSSVGYTVKDYIFFEDDSTTYIDDSFREYVHGPYLSIKYKW